MSNVTNENLYGLTDAQIEAIRCAHADLVGVYQYIVRDEQGGIDCGHDWDAHRASIEDLETQFPEIFPEPVELD